MDAAQTAERIRASRLAIEADREAGPAWARAWRVRTKAEFDARYPQPRATARCKACGQLIA